ncbi:MAG: hypothetical protein PHY02_08280 [Phycisphaerae bacterium]|nr:hypothetical protein [Phycisphaerae bacterium]
MGENRDRVCGVLPEAGTRKRTVSMPEAYERKSIRAGGSTSKFIK